MLINGFEILLVFHLGRAAVVRFTNRFKWCNLFNVRGKVGDC